ncbi:MAG: acylphosphatase [Desulfobulbaceae bacterium]|nr:acylphosphatase [Desulfobulbaceae bacterium]
MTRRRVHAIVRGRVQGVFFRDYTRQKALELGLSGWVRNLPDRSVETVFEGEREKVEEMLSWLHTGSPMSQVTGVDSRDEEPLGTAGNGFSVRY